MYRPRLPSRRICSTRPQPPSILFDKLSSDPDSSRPRQNQQHLIIKQVEGEMPRFEARDTKCAGRGFYVRDTIEQVFCKARKIVVFAAQERPPGGGSLGDTRMREGLVIKKLHQMPTMIRGVSVPSMPLSKAADFHLAAQRFAAASNRWSVRPLPQSPLQSKCSSGKIPTRLLALLYQVLVSVIRRPVLLCHGNQSI